ncbi:MAG TPA: hypothetical protein VHQ86_02255 [Candidatus Saccharimonadia bacterium]|nr:hypothetical protein [Candidatus Saccharimonadia bacterium]
MSSPDWGTISTIASTVALVMGGFLWAASKIFRLGQTAQRLDSIESDVQSLRTELRTEARAIRNDLNHRMDKLILAVSESKHR